MKNGDLSPLGVEALLVSPMRHMGDDRSDVVQPMHGLDVDTEVCGVTSNVALEVCRQVAGRECCVSPMVDVYPIWRSRGQLVPRLSAA